MSVESRRIGREGEKRFGLLCTQAGATCNASIEDDHGWDMLVEFPARASNRPIDERPVPQGAIVQVKTTRSSGRSVRISLDNAIRLAKSPLPAFVVLVVLEGDGSARFFAVHVWRELIGAWLKAGRAADARGVVATNREPVTLRFASADERGDGLLAWMQGEMSAVAGIYAAAKAELVATLGYEGGYGSMSVTVELDEPAAFVELQLGLRESVRLTRLHYVSERFGIKAGMPLIDETAGELSLTTHGRPATLRFTFADGRRVAAPAVLRTAFGAGGPGTLGGWRISTAWFELHHTGPRRTAATACITMAMRLPLDEFESFASLRATPAGQPIGLEVELDGECVDLGSLTLDAGADVGRWNLVTASAQALRAVCLSAARPAPEVSLLEIDQAGTPLEVLAALAGGMAVMLEFEPAPGIAERFDGLMAYASATVGETRYGAVGYRPIVDDVRIGTRRRMTFGPGTLLAGRSTAVTRFDDEWIADEYARQLERGSTSSALLAMGDLAAIVGDDVAGDRLLIRDAAPR